MLVFYKMNISIQPWKKISNKLLNETHKDNCNQFNENYPTKKEEQSALNYLDNMENLFLGKN